MATNNKLKAYVRFDGSGRIIPSSLIVQRTKPKVGNWREINSKECCDNSCRLPIYGDDFQVTDSIDTGAGFILEVNTAPGFVLQVQILLDLNLDMCQTPVAGPIYTIPEGSIGYGIFFTYEEFNTACNVQWRHLCNPDFHSEWVTFGA
jgi:hypothetical protein